MLRLLHSLSILTNLSFAHTALAQDKAIQLISNGIRFSEFGSRRRRSYESHKYCIEGLLAGEQQALASSSSISSPGKLLGTSNVHFAQLFNLVPIGTVAHEWTMAVAALHGYDHVNLRALQLWDQVYSSPSFVPNSPTHDLTIALTDTFSTRVFFDDLLSNDQGTEIAKRWRGLRQDSGDSKAFAQRAKEVYERLGVDPQSKVVIYSDSLNVDKCIDLNRYSRDIGIGAGFGELCEYATEENKEVLICPPPFTQGSAHSSQMTSVRTPIHPPHHRKPIQTLPSPPRRPFQSHSTSSSSSQQ